jgi:hypothetical protein
MSDLNCFFIVGYPDRIGFPLGQRLSDQSRTGHRWLSAQAIDGLSEGGETIDPAYLFFYALEP